MRLLLICVFISFASTNISAQVFFKTEYFEISKYQVTEGNSSRTIGNSKGSAVVYQGGINIPFL